MSGNEERRPVLRGFQHPDHENGTTLLFDPAGSADADPTEAPCSIFTGPIPDDCRWWVEDVPDFEFTDGDGIKRTRHLQVGGDGCGPLVGEPLIDPPKASASAAAAKKES